MVTAGGGLGLPGGTGAAIIFSKYNNSAIDIMNNVTLITIMNTIV